MGIIRIKKIVYIDLYHGDEGLRFNLPGYDDIITTRIPINPTGQPYGVRQFDLEFTGSVIGVMRLITG